MDNDYRLIDLRNACLLLAGIYIVSAFLPVDLAQIKSPPAWIGHALWLANIFLLISIAYGIHSRRRIFWIAIPILLSLYVMGTVLPAAWTIAQNNWPLIPFVGTIAVVLPIGIMMFWPWWRNQRSYFAS